MEQEIKVEVKLFKVGDQQKYAIDFDLHNAHCDMHTHGYDHQPGNHTSLTIYGLTAGKLHDLKDAITKAMEDMAIKLS